MHTLFTNFFLSLVYPIRKLRIQRQFSQEYTQSNIQHKIYIDSINQDYILSYLRSFYFIDFQYDILIIIFDCAPFEIGNQSVLFILSLKEMNRSLTRKSTSKKGSSPVKYNASPSPNNASSSALYFCHYKNAMYMGGIKSFKKDGKGILIHDCGLSVVTNYLNDLMHGHNIFFSQHCLLSAEYVKGKIVDAVYRTDGYMTHITYNNDGQLEGKAKLFNFINKSITYTTFKKGAIIEKEEERDITLLNKVFELGQFDFLIGRVHSSTLKYDIKKANNIEGQKFGNKLTIGFEKGGLIIGLAFTLIFRGIHGGYNPETHRNQDEFELRVIERGYMSNSQLNGFGQKLFKNGNLYIGEFKNGVFQGNGILRNTAKKNWVSGFFEKGNLVDLLEYNNQGEQKKFDKIVQAMHERKTNWINNQIILFDMDIFDKHIERMLEAVPNSTAKTLEQRKQDVLRKIQDNFLCEPNSLPGSYQAAKADLRLFDKNKDETKQSIKRFVHSFIPEIPKQRKIKQDQNSNGDVYQLGASRRLPNSIRKSKIFERTISSDNYLRAQNTISRKKNTSKTPENKKKIFQSGSANNRLRARQINNAEAMDSREFLPKSSKDDLISAVPFGLETSGELNSSNNDIKEKLSQKRTLQRSLGKSKIFKHLQTQVQETAPKFIYTKIDSAKDSQKRKRQGLEYTS